MHNSTSCHLGIPGQGTEGLTEEITDRKAVEASTWGMFELSAVGDGHLQKGRGEGAVLEACRLRGAPSECRGT